MKPTPLVRGNNLTPGIDHPLQPVPDAQPEVEYDQRKEPMRLREFGRGLSLLNEPVKDIVAASSG